MNRRERLKNKRILCSKILIICIIVLIIGSIIVGLHKDNPLFFGYVFFVPGVTFMSLGCGGIILSLLCMIDW